MEPAEHNEELRRTAPHLHGLPKENPFKVPDGFFEQFPHRVQALVAKPEARARGTWLKRMALALPVLAALAVAAHLLRQERPAVMPMDITAEEAAQLLPGSSGSTQDILASASDADWPDLGTITLELTPDEAAAYVDRENIDVTDLITER